MIDLLNEIDKLHQPGRKTRFGGKVFSVVPQRFCNECGNVWPCRTSEIIHSPSFSML